MVFARCFALFRIGLSVFGFSILPVWVVFAFCGVLGLAVFALGLKLLAGCGGAGGLVLDCFGLAG
ncbi:hypothetical protein [Aminobacter sp. AP02]|uniref:hypothetical protein n=1 Tax=Aminobacter sp. AP02 TaxID=2135737 RepID=UPI000D6D69C1|nr:hypothetical protein [Aminobacter sp. AP02]